MNINKLQNIKTNNKTIIIHNWSQLLAFCAFAAILFGIKLWVIGTYGNATPFWDQWDAEAANLYKPYIEGTLRFADLLSPHNEHRIFTTRLLTLALLNINEIWNPLLQMIVNAGLHILSLVLCIALLTRVIGSKYLPALLGFSLVLFGVPYAFQNTLAGFQAQFYFLLLFSISSLWLIVTKEPLSYLWWAGVVCAVFAFLSLASGIIALAAVAIYGLVLYIMGIRKTRKQLFAVAILAVMFILGVILTPAIARHAVLKAASLSQFLIALTAVLGGPISLPAFVFAGFMLWKRPLASDRRWFLFAMVLWGFGQAASIAYGRTRIFYQPRYLDIFAVSVLVNLVCLISLVKNTVRGRYSWANIGMYVWIITVLTGLGLIGSYMVPAYLKEQSDSGLAQEINTRNYLATGDNIYLKNKPDIHSYIPYINSLQNFLNTGEFLQLRGKNLLQVPYPDSDSLAFILASPVVRGILPANMRVPLKPVLVKSQPTEAFVVDGINPKTEKHTGFILGSYGTKGDSAIGETTIHFNSDRQSNYLAIPIAGYPLSKGIRIEIEQNGSIYPLNIINNPKDPWFTAYAKVKSGAFNIHVVDSSNSAWVAVSSPVETGRLDSLTNKLFANYYVFIILGLLAAVLWLVQLGWNSRLTKSV
jgi:hypothetical protein